MKIFRLEERTVIVPLVEEVQYWVDYNSYRLPDSKIAYTVSDGAVVDVYCEPDDWPEEKLRGLLKWLLLKLSPSQRNLHQIMTVRWEVDEEVVDESV